MSRSLILLPLLLLACEAAPDRVDPVDPVDAVGPDTSTDRPEGSSYTEAFLGERAGFVSACNEGRCSADVACIFAQTSDVYAAVSAWGTDAGLSEAEKREAFAMAGDPQFQPTGPAQATYMEVVGQLAEATASVPADDTLVDVRVAHEVLGACWDLVAELE